jgi:hypothetical protein
VKKTAFFVTKSIHDAAVAHLFAVISDPTPDDEVMVVNFSTFRPGKSDTACIVQAGEHPDVKNKSFIFYFHAEVMTTKHIANKCRVNIYSATDDISDALLDKIQTGARASLFLRHELKRFFNYF